MRSCLVFLLMLECALMGCAAGGDGTRMDRSPIGRSPDMPFDNLEDPDLNPDNSEQEPEDRGPPPSGCGNGERASSEACDDGNTESGDGCSYDCRSVEPGFACHPAGTPCRPIARCGDRVLAPSEVCDDGNLDEGDGCSARCKLELGFRCDEPGRPCVPTTCGDGKREGAEACDEGDTLPFDGCSSRCQAEPDCSSGACVSRCGDGLVLQEECDDGNGKDGDGCSSDCTIEPGFTCERQQDCELVDGKCVLRVPVLYRDFSEQHPDFGIGCGNLVTGVVGQQLSAEGKPVLVNGGAACIQSESTFAQWYRSTDALIASELLLYDNENGGFVNRFGPNGEQFEGQAMYQNLTWGGDVGSGCDQCTPSANGQCFDPCTPWNDMNQACCGELMQTFYDGNPLFFPIDDAPNSPDGAWAPAKIPAEYGWDGWPWEDSVFAGAGNHNFHFTTEVVYWFEFDPDNSAALEFAGDDDVWVFVNGQLAVDLGGPHVPELGSVTIDATTAGQFGLAAGEVYEIRVFHAERKREGSSFKLTLSGFDPRPSDCVPYCGDGIVTAGEECDDGVNDGGYEECAPNCVLGESCGDGIVQAGEDCDDGNRVDGDGCGSACVHLIVE
jgi:fibro-slime domain-containing protein